MTTQTIGRNILIFTIVATVIIVAIADVFNDTHLFNPSWPPHARFHNAMQAWTLLLVSLVSLYGAIKGRYDIAVIAPATFWPSLWLSLPVPGTTVYASATLADIGFPINLALSATCLVLTFVGYRMATTQSANSSGNAARIGMSPGASG